MSIYEYRPQEFSLRMGDLFDQPPHLHSHIEVLYLTEGRMQMSINRERTVMEAGDLAIVFPNIVHSFKALEVGGGLEILIFSPSLLRQNRGLLMQQHPQFPFLCADQIHPDVRQAMASLLDEVDHANEQLCPILFDLIMARILPLFHMEDNTEAGLFDMTNQAVGYLMKQFDDPTITLDTVAAHLGISRYRLSRLFTGELGLPFTQYLRYLRVEKAKELLLHSKHSVMQIGMDCGFGTLRSFERAFTEQCGYSPQKYRKQQ